MRRFLRQLGTRKTFRIAALIFMCASAGRMIARLCLYGDRGLNLAFAFAAVTAATLCASAVIRSLVPGLAAADRARTAWRLTAAWRALRGHPVAYKVSTEGGGLTIGGDVHHAIVAGCMFTGLQAAMTEEPAP